MAKKILIVDDEQEIILLIKRRLVKKGYDVVTADSGMKALAAAKHEMPDLILLDVMLPELDGYQVCRLLKFDAKYEKIKIVLVTARDQQVDRDIGQEIRADGFITKPFDPEVLAAKVQELIGESGAPPS